MDAGIVDWNDVHPWNAPADASGIDCSRLATRVLNYSGSKYKAATGAKLGTGGFADKDNTIPIYEASTAKPWKIQDEEERDEQRELLSHAVPGDILVKTGSHVVFIQNLNYPDDTMQITDFSQVDVIHSTKGGTHQEERWNVQKGLWDDLGDTLKNSYQLRRLSVEN